MASEGYVDSDTEVHVSADFVTKQSLFPNVSSSTSRLIKRLSNLKETLKAGLFQNARFTYQKDSDSSEDYSVVGSQSDTSSATRLGAVNALASLRNAPWNHKQCLTLAELRGIAHSGMYPLDPDVI